MASCDVKVVLEWHGEGKAPVSSLENFLEAYGLLAIVLGTFFEGETFLVLAGLAAHRGYLPFSSVVVAGFLGSLSGDQLYFYLGRRHGEALLARRLAWRARVVRAQRFLERHYVAFILGFRFLYGLRIVSPFAVGMSNVTARRYLVVNGTSALIWSLLMAWLGYSIGEAAELFLGRLKEIEGWLFLGIAALGSGVWLAHFVLGRRPGGRHLPGNPGGGNGLL